MKVVREHKRVIESAGGLVEAVSVTGGGHYRYLVLTPSGERMPLIGSNTSSDRRAMLAVRARVRRWCRTQPSGDVGHGRKSAPD